MDDLICRVLASEDKKIHFASVMSDGSSINEIIQDDKQYGKMTPRNGHGFTFRVIAWDGRWIKHDEIVKGVKINWLMIEQIINVTCREVKKDEIPDFKIYFRRLKDDSVLTKNTLMYHYYPISDINNPHRGVCVVNADFEWTTDGEGIPLHIFDPEHYVTPVIGKAISYDFDACYQHESCHGLGLSHSPHNAKKMSPRYDLMAESIYDESDDETIKRLQSKYPKKQITDSKLQRFINYFKMKRDHY